MSGGGLWNDYGACELEYHGTLLLACQQHRMVDYFNSKTDTQKERSRHIFFQYTSLFAKISFRPLPFGLKLFLTLYVEVLSKLVPPGICNRLARAEESKSGGPHSNAANCRVVFPKCFHSQIVR